MEKVIGSTNGIQGGAPDIGKHILTHGLASSIKEALRETAYLTSPQMGVPA